MRRVRTAVIGCGKVGQTHAAALSVLPESEFVAACDSEAARSQAFADRYGVRAYTSVRRMITEAGVEAAIICTPHNVHGESAIEAAVAGAHILVEKPLAASLKDCDAILAASQRAGVKLGSVSQRRFYEPVQRVRSAIDNGKIGRPVLGMAVILVWRDEPYYRSDPWRGKWQGEGGGVMVNQASHHLDLLQWFMGPIEELYGYWDNLNHPYIEVEDTAIAVMRFRSGGMGSLVLSNSQKPGFYCKVQVHGSNGASVGVQTDGGAMYISGMTGIAEPPVNDLWSVPGEEGMLAQWQNEDRAMFQKVDTTTYYHQLQDQDFLQAIIHDRAPLVSGEEARRTVEIFTAVYRSQRDRAPIRFPLDAEEGSQEFDGRWQLPPGVRSRTPDPA
jgi:UDP-N-acetyl-2-amino-2-deoxyglucuronate dehydrogenase